MSNRNSPRGSPAKHKGMKTSLYNERVPVQYQTQPMYQNSKIYVQTVPIGEQPHVLPYIDSNYSNGNRQVIVGDAYSQYVPNESIINEERQNNLMFRRENVVVQPGNIRVSPISINRANLSQTKHEQTFVGSTYVPIPPQTFLLNSTPNSKLPQHRPTSISKAQPQRIPLQPQMLNVPPQQVRKTFIPHHIINEIPVYTQQPTQTYPQQRIAQNISSPHNQVQDQAKQQLMKYYQKLYQKYQAQKLHNSTNIAKIQQLKTQLQSLRQQLVLSQQSRQQEPQIVHVVEQTKYKIDQQRLHDILSTKWNSIVDSVVDRRKQAISRQLNTMFENNKITIKIPGQVIQRRQVHYGYTE